MQRVGRWASTAFEGYVWEDLQLFCGLGFLKGAAPAAAGAPEKGIFCWGKQALEWMEDKKFAPSMEELLAWLS